MKPLARLRAAAAVLAGLLAGGAALGQEGISWTARGYADLIATGWDVNGAAQANPGNRLRLPGSDTSLQADATAEASVDRYKAVGEAYARSDRRRSEEDTARVNQLYGVATSRDQRWYLRVGKVVPAWGVGQLWNPVRALTNEARRDLVFPNESVEGLKLAQLQVVTGADSAVSAWLLPARGDRAAGALLRLSSAADGLDYALSVGTQRDDTHRLGAELSWVTGETTLLFELAWTSRSAATTFGADGLRQAPRGGPATSFVVGANRVLPGDLVLTAEYFHDGEGLTRPQFQAYAARAFENLDLYNPLGNGRDTTYLGLTQRFLRNDSTATAAWFHNVQSGVSLLQLHAESQLGARVRAIVTASRYLQRRGGPEVNLYRSSLDIRLRAHF